MSPGTDPIDPAAAPAGPTDAAAAPAGPPEVAGAPVGPPDEAGAPARPPDAAGAPAAPPEVAGAPAGPPDVAGAPAGAGDAPVAADRAVKRRRLLELLDERGADRLLLTSATALSWYLDGARVHVSLAGDPIAAVVVGREGDEWRVFANEADRLLAEELPHDPAATLTRVPWHEPLAADLPGALREPDVSAELRAARASLLPGELARYRALCREVAEVLTDAAAAAHPEQSERDVAATLAAGLAARGIDPLVTLVAGRSRLVHRHPLPTAAPIGDRAMRFLMAATVGLLLFLGVDAFFESFELAQEMPGALQGIGVMAIGMIGAIALLDAIGRRQLGDTLTADQRRGRFATMVAIGMGLHNLGEGLASGAAFALGEAALGTFLVIGFIIQNITEGLGVVVPLAKQRPGYGFLALLALVAGAPAILGAWIGGLAIDPVWSMLFLAIGAGAVFQVAWQIGRELVWNQREGREQMPLVAFGGLMTGMLALFVTGLMIK